MFLNKIMKKFLSIFFTFTLIGVFLGCVISYSKAQESPTPNGPAAAQLKVQLTPTQTGNLTADLFGHGLVPNFEVYIVDCFPTDDNLKCTTGNPEYDGPAKLGIGSEPPVQPRVEIIDGALKTSDAQGEIRASVRSLSINSSGHLFYGIQINPPFLTNEGRGDTLQYGTFQFDPAITPIDFRADPFGRIFDSQSLEPISGIKITILDKDKKPANTKSPDCPREDCPTVNSVNVGPDGEFHFMAEEGIYYLQLDEATHPNHSFSANPNLHPNYIKAYAGITLESYPSDDKTHQVFAKLYFPDEVIDEKSPDEQQRDIPLKPKGTPYKSDPVSMVYDNVVNGLKTNFSGKVSHPLSKVALVVKETDGTIIPISETISADKYGFWTIILDNDNIPQNQPLTLQITAVDLTQDQALKQPSDLFSKIASLFSSLFKKAVVAQTKEPVFQPIPRYIEGYAYDTNNKVIPQATVKVKLYMSKAVYYQTTADENGYFKIDPQNLPIFSYYLEFTPPASKIGIRTTTAEFAQKNTDYLQANKIDLMTAQKNNNSLLTVIAAQPTTGQPPQETPIAQQPKLPSQLNLFVVILLFVGLVGVAGALYFFFKKKNQL
jgi:hypothetical protein